MKLAIQLGSREFSLNLGRRIDPAPASMKISAPPRQRGYAAAQVNRLNSDWLMPRTSADVEIKGGIWALIGRARQLERDNEYAQRYLTLLENNVLGHCGVKLQMKIQNPSGIQDAADNKTVSDAWERWSDRKNCSVNGQICWREIEAFALRRCANDGGILIRLMRGWNNPFGFAVQPLEIDHLDLDYNLSMANGNEIRFGIEFDVWKRPIALHLFSAHPGDTFSNRRQRIRIPAADILHLYWSERPGQTIGVPWMACVMQALEHLGKYREAELVAARVSACKGGWFEKVVNADQGYDPQADDGTTISETQPGQWEELPLGWKAVPNDPTHPNQAFSEFIKGALRGIAGGLGVNYNSLANDLESVNFSSMRAGRLEEVEEYKNIQSWLIESLHAPVFEAWLEMALLRGALKSGNGATLPISKFDKFNAADWKPRRWPWVDPQKDMQASILAVEKGFKSRRAIIAEMGDDIETVFEEQELDEKLAVKHHLEFPLDTPAPVAAGDPVNTDDGPPPVPPKN